MRDCSPVIPKTRQLRWRCRMAFGGVVLAAAALRLPVISQSLWYDEMYTLLNYLLQPWERIVAGEYSPNNHIFFTLLAKLVMPDIEDLASLQSEIGRITATIRLVSLLAGITLPVALAWGIRKEQPYQAILLAVIAAVHPWAIGLSGWARGYSLLLLLAVMATVWLPRQHRAVHWGYVLTVTAAMYTQPIAVLLVAGHATAMVFLRRPFLGTWLRSAGLAGAITLCLYLPFLGGARQYWSASRGASTGYVHFVAGSLRHAQTGDDIGGMAAIAVALLLVVAGSWMAWRAESARPMLISFGTAAAIGLLMPLAIPSTGEVRAMLWLLPLYCMGSAAVLASPMGPKWTGWVGTAILLTVMGMQSHRILRIPTQPIREAIAEARSLAGSEGRVIGVYMAASEARILYGGIDAVAYCARPSPSPATASMPSLRDAESGSEGTTIGVVFYESFVRRSEPGLWEQLQQRYELVARFPGRTSPAAVYRRRNP